MGKFSRISRCNYNVSDSLEIEQGAYSILLSQPRLVRYQGYHWYTDQ